MNLLSLLQNSYNSIINLSSILVLLLLKMFLFKIAKSG